METLVAQATADFAAASNRTQATQPSSSSTSRRDNTANRRRGRGKPKPITGPSQEAQPQLAAAGDHSQVHLNGNNQNRTTVPPSRGHGRGPRRRGPRGPSANTSGAPSTASSDNEGLLQSNADVTLPAPATQVTRFTKQSKGPRYRSQLSEATSAPGPSRSSTTSRYAPPTEEELEKLSYRERLTAQLNTSSIDCPICINNIHRKQPIASCQTCSAPYHLKCLRDWAERSIATVKEKAALQQNQPGVQIRANWRCPSCQTQYHEDARPRVYWCFCGRVKDPQVSPLGNAHSCEQPCKKPRPEGCDHPCPLNCHAGTCDACSVILRMRCHCGKEEKTIKCGTLHPQSGTEGRMDVNEFLSCDQTCGRLLPCGLHRCDKLCHDGACGDCVIVREKQCYCGRDSITEDCGGVHQASLRYSCSQEGGQTEWTGEYSCGQPCPWVYDCGKHAEAALSSAICHPHASSYPLPCPRTPAFVSTCPCGKKSLEDITSNVRNSCSDPVPTCGQTCNRVRNSCGHPCTSICHEGPCEPCNEEVTLVCRCGNDKKTLKCRVAVQEQANEFQCERTCRALRACGRHECARKCCPLAYQEANKKQRRRPLPLDNEDPLGLHICDRVCGRKLNCGQHDCEQPDHRGPCPPCLRSSFEEISCNCGSTVLMPPVPCSTRIRCNQPCARPNPPCGHQKPPHTCHEDDTPCPPCPFLTEKQCMCGSSTVKNVRCSQATVSCGKPCGKLLGCGFHRCKKMCHSAGECEECAQTCGKPKSICGHPCQKKCHAPSKCPQTEACTELVEATCPCGNVKQRARCGACTSSPASNGGQKLPCAPSCAVAQRNAALAEALGINKDRQSASSSQITTWPPETLQYYGENMTWAKGIEQSFTDLLSSNRATHLFPPMKYPQRKFIHDIAQKYKLRSESLDEEPFRSVLIAKKAESDVPTPSLSDAWISTFKQARSATPSQAPKRTILTQVKSAPLNTSLSAAAAASTTATPLPSRPDVNCLYLEACFGHDEESLRDIIRPCAQGLPFELLWVNDEDVICLLKAQLNASDLTLKLRLLRTALRHKVTNCKSVDAAWYDAAAGAVTYKEQSWTSVSARNQQTNSAEPHTSTNTSLEAVNAFSRLGINDSAKNTGSNTGITSTALGNGTGNTVLTNGLNRPPRAIVIGDSADPNESVVDSWEDAV